MNFAPHCDKRAPHLRKQTAGPLSCLAQNFPRSVHFCRFRMSNSTTTKKTQNSLWLLRRAFSCIPCIHPALCIFLWSNVFLGSLKPLKPLEPLESLSALSALHKPLRLTAPPARRGRRAQFRPPLPTSPIVGEGYLGEEWSDGTGNEFVIRNKNAPQAPQLTHLWWLLVALARHRRCLFCVDVRSTLFRAFGCQ